MPALPGCITEGDAEELIANLKDAINGWLEVAGSKELVEPEAQVLELTV